jgi:predicted PolB exonuclease-like 3'-5' exonuclease
MLPRKLLVFDLETIPDTALGRAVHHDWAELEDIAVRAKLSAAMLEKTQMKSDFLPPIYHQVVCISCLMADIEYHDGTESYHFRKLWSVGEAGDDEATILRQFLHGAGKESYRLVSYNGLGFDLLTLRFRALKHGLSAPWLFGWKDKWKNHFTKSSPEFHEDLADLFGVRGVKLDELCKLVGLPGKMDVAGQWVADLMADGQTDTVRNYCETDILNTYLLYLHYKQLTGALAPDARQHAESTVVDMLVQQAEHKPHLAAVLTCWQPGGPAEISHNNKELPNA